VFFVGFIVHVHKVGSLALSATSQQYFSLGTNQPISNQPAVLFSQNKPAPAISHQPTEQACTSVRFCVVGSRTFVEVLIE
jgi:hypothetical protein